MKILCAILLGLSLTCANATDKSPKRPASMEELERIDLAQDGMAAVDKMQASLERLGRKNRLACMKAFGSDKFCTCLSNKLPIAVNFMAYVRIMTSSKDELGYDKAEEKDKQLVDLTYKVREACVQGGH